MNALWISLKGNMNCVAKIRDVAMSPDKIVRRKSPSVIEEPNFDSNDEDPLLKPMFRHFYITNRFHELEIGDPSRNVIEKIFRASSTNPTKCSRKVKRVVKVNNPLDILTKFEKYRETVMVSSKHPRSIVDGNELLQFYGTTMSCCGKNTAQMSQLCRDPSCRVCRVIQCGFNTSYNKIYGIRLSKNSEHMSEDENNKVGKNVKKAVIVCRTIAGGGVEDDDDGLNCKCESSMVVRNPSAILPCFVIVLH